MGTHATRHTSWIVLLAVGAVVFAAGAVGWADFLGSNTCHDVGGTIESGECAGAMAATSLWWDAPWQRIAYTLIPPAVLAIVIVAMVWATGRKDEREL